MDGGGFKAFWSDFCKAYTEYVLNDISPLCFSVGSRKYTEVYKDMDAKKKKLAKSQLANISPKDKHVMPFSNNNIEDNVIIVSRRIDKEHFQKALSYCKAIGATANDLLVAAYIHSLAIVSDIKDDDVELESKMIFKQIEEFLSLNNVSRELLVNLVDKIVLSQDKVVKIYYKFKLL